MRIFIIVQLFLHSINSFAQNEDNVWIMGYGGGSQSSLDDSFGLSILRFDANSQVSIQNNQTSNLNFDSSNSSICDSTGNLLFYSNGEKVYSRNHTLLVDGNNLNVTNAYGAKQPQGVLSLPYPKHSDQFFVFISEIKIFSPQLVAGIRMYKNIVSIDPNEIDESQVIEKKIIILEDTIEYGQITAVKHANGQDWWVIVPESHTNKYYTMLLDSSGLHLWGTQSIGDVFYSGLGQAVFSPDGSKYARVNSYDLFEPNHLYIYDFDRCSGQLSNPIHLEYENWGLGMGCAVSRNSRFLYAINASFIFQYDLLAPEIAASKTLVAEWDGYIHEQHFYTTFAGAQLAPDGKIYISTAGSTPFLHAIECPDRKGLACQVHQRAIHLPNYNSDSAPNFPNFRLGPIDNSNCDTLGLDNHPLCNWRWEQEDTLNPLEVTFTDLTSYLPVEWHWSFGDGASSQDTSPVHNYQAEGEYNVCLVVNNQYNADTFCQVVQLGISAVQSPDDTEHIVLSPNPFFDNLNLHLKVDLPNPIFRLYNQLGIKIIEENIDFDKTQINTTTIPPGIYFWEILAMGKLIKTGKAIKVGR